MPHLPDAPVATLLQDVRNALASDDVAGAMTLLDRGIEDYDDPELHLVRGQLSYFTLDWEGACSHLERSVRLSQEAGLPRRAALAASWVGRTYDEGRKNRVVARGWFARADRLLEGQRPCLEEGWIAVALIGCTVRSAEALDRDARLALETARRFGDVDLEAKALADGGLALVSAGRIDEGMAWLDESMAMVTSGQIDPSIGGQASCSMLSACERSGDLARAQSWLEVLDERSGILFTHCRIACGTLLCEVGRWDEGDAILREMIEVGDTLVPFHRVSAHAALADLRIRQGRLDEAERLLLGYDDQVDALLPLARLYLARENFDLAAAVARRALRALGGDRVRKTPLLVALTQAELGRGDMAAARRAVAAAGELVVQVDVPAMMAQAALAGALVEAAAGEPGMAIRILEDALVRLGPDQLPMMRSALHLELARLHEGRGDRAAAESEARAMVAILARLGAEPVPDAAVLLRRLGLGPGSGVAAADTAVTGADVSLAWDGKCWDIVYGTATARLRDTKGLRYLAQLIERPGVEHHALDLVNIARATTGAPPDAGDAGEMLDAQAKAAYRVRLEQLREEMDEAEACIDVERSWRIQAEIDAVVAELARAVGLGGRDRRAASVAERARINVTRALRAAIRNVADVQPDLGRHLDASVRTGIFCSYAPAPGSGVRWTLRAGS
jgi:tetratricopeptide (TPR) repeat protein